MEAVREDGQCDGRCQSNAARVVGLTLWGFRCPKVRVQLRNAHGVQANGSVDDGQTIGAWFLTEKIAGAIGSDPLNLLACPKK